jgi:parallel beta-helix repeat protein
MAIEFTWIDRVDGVNYVRAADVNKLAEGVIRATNEINQLGATKSDKTTVAALDNRVNQIITTPIDGAAATQEVVDARGNAASLGGRLDGIEAQLASHAKTARFVIGTSTAGWTSDDCDYLCDGTNDQEEIIQALNDLPATGGEVVILDGTYNITASINIPKDNVSIRGSGNATTLKRRYNSTNTDSGATAKGLITLNEKSGCKIQGLQIDGNKATYTASYNYGIYLSSSSNNNTVTGNTCNNNYNGIYLSSSSNNTITGNTCNNNNSYGIYLSSSSNNTITGNTCNNNNYGIFLYSSSNNNIVMGNTCIRGTGQASDYTSTQQTIKLQGTSNNYNLISSNNCMGKAVVISGGTGNSAWGNKFDNTDDLP